MGRRSTTEARAMTCARQDQHIQSRHRVRAEGHVGGRAGRTVGRLSGPAGGRAAGGQTRGRGGGGRAGGPPGRRANGRMDGRPGRSAGGRAGRTRTVRHADGPAGGRAGRTARRAAAGRPGQALCRLLAQAFCLGKLRRHLAPTPSASRALETTPFGTAPCAATRSAHPSHCTAPCAMRPTWPLPSAPISSPIRRADPSRKVVALGWLGGGSARRLLYRRSMSAGPLLACKGFDRRRSEAPSPQEFDPWVCLGGLLWRFSLAGRSGVSLAARERLGAPGLPAPRSRRSRPRHRSRRLRSSR